MLRWLGGAHACKDITSQVQTYQVKVGMVCGGVVMRKGELSSLSAMHSLLRDA